MGAVVSDVDLAELRSLYPLAKFDAGFTGQQEQLLLYFMKGMNPIQAARAAGYTNPSHGASLLREEAFQRAIELLREKYFQEVRITRDMLNAMLLDSHSKAAGTIEEVAAIRELGKLNGLYESDKQRAKSGQTTVQVNVGSQVTNQKQIERMDDQQLMEIAGEVITLSTDDYEVKSDE